MYKRALEKEPDHANILVNYAIFLKNIRKDYDRAEEMYKRALEKEPDRAYILGNYAGFLLALGRAEGREVLARARLVLAGAPEATAELECAFYDYANVCANGPEVERAAALSRIRELLLAGTRSPGWNLSANIDQALADGHPEGPWLAKLAAVINDEALPSSLDDWPAWQLND
jgi:tetratricopeptide (TPR) repeat protein